MRARVIRCLWFIDVCLLDLPSRPLALLARKTVEDLFVRSDLTRAPDKGVWVTTQTLPDHLGVEISTASATGWIKVPQRRWTFRDRPRISCVGPRRAPGVFHRISYDRS